MILTKNYIDRRASYLGQVATRCYIPKRFNTSMFQFYSRTPHIALDDIASLQIVIPNFYVATDVAPSDGTEATLGTAMTCTASVEYPAGTFTQIKFSGSASGSVPSGGMLLSDACAVSIPYGATFYIRIWYSNAGGVIWVDAWNPISGDQAHFGVTTTDRTMGGDASATTVTHFTAAAIIAYTRRQSVLLIGDSIMRGANSAGTDGGDTGIAAPSVRPAAAYINAGVGSDLAAWFVASHTNRLALAAYCTDVIMQYGTNDIGYSQTKAQILANLNTICGYFSATKRVYVNTVPPRTTSTDSWATEANQTVIATESVRVDLNNAIRLGNQTGGVIGCAGIHDICSALESGYNSGLWKSAPNYLPTTEDGVHPGESGNLLVRQSGVIKPALFCVRG